jgi:hypothetical protein
VGILLRVHRLDGSDEYGLTTVELRWLAAVGLVIPLVVVKHNIPQLLKAGLMGQFGKAIQLEDILL